MRRQIIRVVVTVVAVMGVALAVAAQSADARVGTWKLNLAKSKYNPGPAPKSNTIKNEPLKSTSDGIDAQGKPTHTEISYKFDGKDYPLKGAAAANTTRAYRRIDDHTWEFVTKVDGKVTTTNRNVISPDGKTQTGTTTGKDAQGQTVNNTLVFDKQ